MPEYAIPLSPLDWQGVGGLPSRSYVCGYCGHLVGPDRGWHTGSQPQSFIYICSHCLSPTFFDPSTNRQNPGSPYGREVEGLDADVGELYREARLCVQAGAPTASLMVARKLLAHVAVAQGAKPGETFAGYVDYLANNGFVPPQGKAWVDEIRRRGNDANHEIVVMSRADAEAVLGFLEGLLLFIYELPSKIAPPGDSSET
jgi:hypothetical protein